MVMAEEHGMYKGLAPGEREQDELRTMVARSDGAALHCFVIAVTAKSCPLESRYSPAPHVR